MTTSKVGVIDFAGDLVLGAHAMAWDHCAAWRCTGCAELNGALEDRVDRRGVTCKCGRRYELLRDAQGAVTAIKELDETRRASWQGDAGSSRV